MFYNRPSAPDLSISRLVIAGSYLCQLGPDDVVDDLSKGEYKSMLRASHRLKQQYRTISTMSDLTLYTYGTPNGHKASVTLEELGVKYTAKSINITKNEQKEPSFLKINPNGRIPALTDGSQRIFETGAIMLYLTDKYDTEHKISFAQGSSDYYECLSWVMWQMGGLGPMQGQANHFRLMVR